MKTKIKLLTKKDISTLKDLSKLFGKAFDDMQTYGQDVPSDVYLGKFLSNKDNIVLVADIGGKTVGGLVAYTLTKFERERKEVFIYDLAVAPDHQRQGIGRKLIEELRIIAKAKGAYVVFVQADEGDDAIKFYESLGPDENSRTRNFDYLTWGIRFKPAHRNVKSGLLLVYRFVLGLLYEFP